jgi:AraC-like DNA-binding protein
MLGVAVCAVLAGASPWPPSASGQRRRGQVLAALGNKVKPEICGWHNGPMSRTAGVDDAAPTGQSYVERPPVPALAGLVSSVWIQRVAPDADPYTQRNIPHGGVELLCRVGSVPRVVGPLTRALVEVLAPGTTVVGVRFRPGAAPSVLGLPASELVDLAVETDELWGRAAVALGERVADAASPEEALARLQQHIVGRSGDAPGPDPLVSQAVRQLMPWRTDHVGSLTSSLYISDRQLRRRCQAAVGLAPKALHRMLRFQGFLALTQAAFARGRAPTDAGVAVLAAEAGYADQPHLTRECLRLTGLPPRAFLGEAADHCGCGHDHTAAFLPLLRSRPLPDSARV